MKKKYAIKGMTCNSCSVSIENALSVISDVEKVVIDMKTKEAIITTQKNVQIEILQVDYLISILFQKWAKG